jgi:predicted SAM-dependent methyltransferase
LAPPEAAGPLLPYLNIGCGTRFHPAWINIDLVASAPCVRALDVSRGIPLSDGHCRVVYHSHVLEHLNPLEGLRLLRECHRVLAPGGVLRVVVPDLEGACRHYLETLERARRDPAAEADHRWMVIELIDQLSREREGGEMADYLSRDDVPNAPFVLSRIGEDAARILESRSTAPTAAQRARRLLRGGRAMYERLVGMLLLRRRAAEALAVGRFRVGGEPHKWMYDSFSLARILEDAGFRSPLARTASASQIEGWTAFGLDAGSDGLPYRPDSLFMEAVRAE